MAEKTADSGVLAPIEKIVMPIVSGMPYVKTWMAAYFHPVETFQSQKAAGGFGAVVVNLLLIGVLAWLATMLSFAVGLNFTQIAALAIGIAVYPVIMVIANLIGSAVMFVIAKVLGGKGGYMEQTFALTLVFGGYTAFAFPFTVLSGLPFVGAIFGLAAMLIALYSIYNEYLVLKAVHQLSGGKAALVILIPIIIAVIIAFVLAAVLVAMFAGVVGAAALGNAGGY